MYLQNYFSGFRGSSKLCFVLVLRHRSWKLATMGHQRLFALFEVFQVERTAWSICNWKIWVLAFSSLEIDGNTINKLKCKIYFNLKKQLISKKNFCISKEEKCLTRKQMYFSFPFFLLHFFLREGCPLQKKKRHCFCFKTSLAWLA